MSRISVVRFRCRFGGLALEGRVKLESTTQWRYSRPPMNALLHSGPLGWCLGNLNFPNRRIRTRTSGGVGGT